MSRLRVCGEPRLAFIGGQVATHINRHAPSPIRRGLERTAAPPSFWRSRVRVDCPGAASPLPPSTPFFRHPGEGRDRAARASANLSGARCPQQPAGTGRLRRRPVPGSRFARSRDDERKGGLAPLAPALRKEGGLASLAPGMTKGEGVCRFRHPSPYLSSSRRRPGQGGAREREPAGSAAVPSSLREQFAFGAALSRGLASLAPGMTKGRAGLAALAPGMTPRLSPG